MVNLNQEATILNFLHIDFSNRLKKYILTSLAFCGILFIVLFFAQNQDIEIYVALGIAMLYYIVAFVVQSNNRQDITLNIISLCPILLILYISYSFPNIKNESIFFLTLAIGVFIYIVNTKQAFYIFLLYAVLAIVTQLYEYNYCTEDIPPNYVIINQVVIFISLTSIFLDVFFLSNLFINIVKKGIKGELQLTVKESEFSDLFTNAYDAVVFFDFKNDEIIKFNDAFKEMFHVAEGQTDVKINDIFPLEQTDGKNTFEHLAANKQYFETNERPLRVNFLHRRLTGEIFESEITIINNKLLANQFIVVIKDLTELTRIQESLKRSEKKYRDLIEIQPSGIILSDKAGNFLYTSPNSRAIFGYSDREAFPSDNLYKYITPTAKKQLQTHVRSLKEGKISKSFLLEGKHEKGHIFYLEVVSKLLLDEEINKEKFLFVFNDVTDKIKANQQLEKSEKRYHDIFDNSHQGIFLYDVNIGKLLECNEAAMRIFKATKQQLVDASFSDVIASGLLEEENFQTVFERNRASILNTGQTHQLFRGKRFDGQIFIGDGTAVLNFTEEHKLVLFFISDITDKYNAEEEVKKRTAIYEALVNNSFEGIDIVELSQASTQEDKLISRNDVMLDFFNGSKDPLTRLENVLSLTPKVRPNGELTADYFKRWVYKLQTEGAIFYDWQIIHPNGKLFDLETFTQILTIQEKRILIRIYKDISERKKQETLIQQQVIDLNKNNEELKKYIDSNLQLENFAYIASHDLQSPLRTIVSFTQLLKRSLNNKLSKDELEYMEFIISSSKNMRGLINALLTFSRANTEKLNVITFDPARLLRVVQSELGSAIDEKNAQIILQNIPNSIQGDRVKLKQLFQNLISNALKFTKKDRQPVITISSKETQKHWQFSIQDNGIGIAPEFQEKIFLLFKRLHTNAEYEGTGIGLSLCKKLVEQHKGNIGVKSELEKGSTFYFTIAKKLLSEGED